MDGKADKKIAGRQYGHSATVRALDCSANNRRPVLDNADAAEQLNDAVHESARLIGARRPRWANARYRFWSIPRLRYLLAYTDAPTRLGLCGSCILSRDLPRVLVELLD
jgi:hypothetical protein